MHKFFPIANLADVSEEAVDSKYEVPKLREEAATKFREAGLLIQATSQYMDSEKAVFSGINIYYDLVGEKEQELHEYIQSYINSFKD